MDEETRLANYQAKKEASIKAKDEAGIETNKEARKKLGSKISNAEWSLFLGAMAMIDLSQVVLDIFAIGLAANRIVDLTVVMAMPLYLSFRGFKLDTKVVMLIAGSLVAEEIPLLDAAPFWTYDAWRFYKLDQERKKNDEGAYVT